MYLLDLLKHCKIGGMSIMATTFLIKQRYCVQKNEIDVENLRNSTLQEVATIPPENVQRTSSKNIRPCIEASKYYIEEEELRSMFAKILASSLIIERTRLYTHLSLKLSSN